MVPPSVMALAGPSTNLPEVLPTAKDQPLAVFPGTHTVPSIAGKQSRCSAPTRVSLNANSLFGVFATSGGPQPLAEHEQHRKEKTITEEQLVEIHRRMVRSINTLAQSNLTKMIVHICH